ncbi:hypothetical protein EV679_0328 [Kerstersia gyiorum]|uniref:Uncharacterized protein n=1 Tax=Kerstersia gyiorum TaxID=206506 RepID=A0A4Q7MYB7_9BURK|nr:hypothetical protein [Kerstersia gyiorum]RZS73140.1 hypothetical protein EV679_0328 [Kerstersia gyiorum]
MKAIERRLSALEAARPPVSDTERRPLDAFYRDQDNPQSTGAIQFALLYPQEASHEQSH